MEIKKVTLVVFVVALIALAVFFAFKSGQRTVEERCIINEAFSCREECNIEGEAMVLPKIAKTFSDCDLKCCYIPPEIVEEFSVDDILAEAE